MLARTAAQPSSPLIQSTKIRPTTGAAMITATVMTNFDFGGLDGAGVGGAAAAEFDSGGVCPGLRLGPVLSPCAANAPRTTSLQARLISWRRDPHACERPRQPLRRSQ